MATSGLTEEAFQIIGAGESVEVEFDAAELHDLSTAGEIDIVSSGAFSYAEADSTELAGTIPFSSNSVHTAVNGEEAAAVRARFLAKRTVVQSDCTGTRRTATVGLTWVISVSLRLRVGHMLPTSCLPSSIK